ncbi:hypothetical protein EHM82_02270, partial [bacterium]
MDRSAFTAPGGLAALLGLALLTGLATLPAGADWLVTRQGGRVEIRGAWEVKGKLVVFRTLDGTLSSLRTSEVDFEASRKATEEAPRARAAAAAAKQPPGKKPSVLVLTDKDVRHVEETSAAPADAASEAAGEGEGEGEGDDLTVATWERASDPGAGHVVITGTLRNAAASSTATGILLLVSLYDESGQQTGAAEAVLTATALPAGQQSGFRAEFPGVFSFSRIEFAP